MSLLRKITEFLCKIGIHGDPIYDYSDWRSYCSRCGRDKGPTEALMFLAQETAERGEKLDNGEIEGWEYWQFVDHMWDRGYPEGYWEELYEMDDDN